MSNGDITTQEKTKRQIVGVSFSRPWADGYNSGYLGKWVLRNRNAMYWKHRKMRLDPTISFARLLCVAPLVTAGWSYESNDEAPDGAVDLIEETFEPLRMRFMKSLLEGCLDYGWVPYEIVMGTNDDGLQCVTKLKQLVQDGTQILVDPDTGAVVGLRQGTIDLYGNECIIVTLDVEGTDWYGHATMRQAEEPYEKWREVELAASRYDKKIAGTHLVIKYPVGSTPVNGVETDNYEIAQKFGKLFEASGTTVMPSRLTPYEGQATDKEDAWKVELLSDNSAGKGAFTERQKYLDALKMRALGLPERMGLEGQFGTKAEAASHTDSAMIAMSMRHALACEQLNSGPVDAMLIANYGPEAKGSVWITPVDVNDSTLLTLRGIYTQLLTNPESATVEIPTIDTDALKDKLSIPRRPPEPLIGPDDMVPDLVPDVELNPPVLPIAASFIPAHDPRTGRFTNVAEAFSATRKKLKKILDVAPVDDAHDLIRQFRAARTRRDMVQALKDLAATVARYTNQVQFDFDESKYKRDAAGRFVSSDQPEAEVVESKFKRAKRKLHGVLAYAMGKVGAANKLNVALNIAHQFYTAETLRDKWEATKNLIDFVAILRRRQEPDEELQLDREYKRDEAGRFSQTAKFGKDTFVRVIEKGHPRQGELGVLTHYFETGPGKHLYRVEHKKGDVGHYSEEQLAQAPLPKFAPGMEVRVDGFKRRGFVHSLMAITDPKTPSAEQHFYQVRIGDKTHVVSESAMQPSGYYAPRFTEGTKVTGPDGRKARVTNVIPREVGNKVKYSYEIKYKGSNKTGTFDEDELERRD